MAYTLSATSLSLFSNCPRCFWLALNSKIKRPNGPFPSLPNGMDRVLKEHFDNLSENESKIPKEFKKLGLKPYLNKVNLAKWRSIGGIRAVDSQGNSVIGALDTVFMNKTNELVVIDFKTRGYPPNETSHTYYETQLAIYVWLLQQMGEKVSEKAYLIFYHPISNIDPNVFLFAHEVKEMKVNLEKIEKLLLRAHNCLKSPLPSIQTNCDYCQWGIKTKQPTLSQWN